MPRRSFAAVEARARILAAGCELLARGARAWHRAARRGRKGAAKARLACALVAAAALAACGGTDDGRFQGYAEGEYVNVASPYAGALERLAVARGERVEAGALLFALERGVEQAAVDAARARIRSAEARIANLSTGRRKPEIDALRAETESAAAARELARIQLEQNERLHAAGFVSAARLDEARAAYARAVAQLNEAEAGLRAALQSLGRAPEIDAARAEFDAARAELAQASARLAQKTGVAPTAALVHDTWYREGEWVQAGSPVVTLLPPANVKVRFFVPETAVGALREGMPVTLACDGCGAPFPATVTYVSPQAEYTPPVIYGRESRAKLVFLVEARPGAGDRARLRPGQPVDVTLAAARR